MSALALDAVALRGAHREHDVLRPQLVVAAADRDADARPVAQRGGHTGRVERGDRLRHQRHLTAEERAERPVVGLDLVTAELLRGGDEAHAPDVELVPDDVGERFDRLPLATGRDDDRFAERLAHLDLRGPPRPEPETHRLPREPHRLFELLVSHPHVGGPRKIAQMHARQRAVEVVVDLVRHERAERCEQLGDREQAAPQRLEGGHVAVPEAPPRAAHIPIGELVDELGDRPSRGRGVVRLQALGHEFRRRGGARERPAVESASAVAAVASPASAPVS